MHGTSPDGAVWEPGMIPAFKESEEEAENEMKT